MLRYNYNFLRTKNELFKFHRLKSKCIVLPKNKLGKGIVILGNIKLGEREREREREGEKETLREREGEKETLIRKQVKSRKQFAIPRAHPIASKLANPIHFPKIK